MIIKILIIFIIGLILGSFLNSLIYRLPLKINLWQRSFCPKCNRKIKPGDLVPLFSFLKLKGLCRFCKQNISGQYFFVELLTAILFVLFFIKHTEVNIFLIRDFFLVFILLLILFIDFKHQLILDNIIWPAFLVVLIFNFYLGLGLLNLLLGIIIGAGFFALQYFLTKGNGIGFGDIKFGVLIGIIFGWQLTILTIVISYIIGGGVALLLLVSKTKKIGDKLPLAVFISSAAIIVLLIGDYILKFLN